MNNRKFNLTCVILLLNYFALFFDKISGESFIQICMAILGIYVAGNVIQKNVKYEKVNRTWEGGES